MEEKSREKISWIPLAVILVIAGIAAGLYLFYFSKETATASSPSSADNSISEDGAATLVSVMTKTSQAVASQTPSPEPSLAKIIPVATIQPDVSSAFSPSTSRNSRPEMQPVSSSDKNENTPAADTTEKPVELTSTATSPVLTLEVTSTPTAEGSPTPTLAMIPTEQDPGKDFTAWCLPKTGIVPDEWRRESLAMPPGGQPGIYEKGMIKLKFPFIACTFLYHLPQPVSEGMEISIYDEISKTPWFKTKINPSKNNRNIGYSQITHAYIIEPPFWKITYRFVLKDVSGNILREDKVHLHKWEPEPCPDGSLPNPVTEYCPYIPQP